MNLNQLLNYLVMFTKNIKTRFFLGSPPAKIKDWMKLNAVPYDAEVEYLESTGTQWIDTNIEFTGASSAGVDIVFEIPISLNNTSLCGAQTTARSFIGYGYVNSIYFTSGTVAASSSACAWGYDSDVKYSAKMSVANGTLSVNFQGSVKTQQVGYQWSAETFALFGNKGQGQYSSVRIYKATISKDGFVLANLIPVRFTNELGQSEGAMYDRMSRKLFRNAGTGAFIYGADKIPVETDRYVQDGLIAMWDGKENAGVGLHDPNATTWTDIVGNATLATSASSDSWEWTSDSLWTRAVNFGANITNTNYVNALRTTYSVEYVGTVVSMAATKYVWTMTSWASSYQRYGGLGVTYGDKYSIYCNGSANGTGLTNTGVAYHAEDRVQTSYVYRMTEGNCDFYKDANLITTAASGNVVEPASMIPYIAVGGPGNDKGPSVKHHCVRLYNRALTAAEIAANYAIDKARFNLP